MITDIAIKRELQPVVMKSGIVHWVTINTAANIQHALNTQTSHSFIKIRELAITVNTSQIEGVYTTSQYEDMMRLKQGMWQCTQHTWHARKDDCRCRSELYRKNENDRRQRESDEKNRPANPAEMERIGESLKNMRASMMRNGILAPKKIEGADERTCVMCSNKLEGFVRYYCSGTCIENAKRKGIFGREEDLKEAANAI